MFDFIVVGAGLAGVTFCNLLEKNRKSFCIISNNSQIASLVAGGVYNPVVLKRFTPVWKADEQMQLLTHFYAEIEQKINAKINIPIPVLRKFTSVEEQNNWFCASDKNTLAAYLNPNVISVDKNHLPAPFGFGQVWQTGRLDVKTYLNACLTRWKNEGVFHQKTFDYSELQITDTAIHYKSVPAKNIVFCEGYGIVKNPFFNYLPMKPCKGETLTIYVPDLQLKEIVKSDGVMLPMGNDFYKIGATYRWDDLSDTITDEARSELIEKLNKLITCRYEIVEQEAAIRPTVSDRRPLVGKHPNYNNVWIINGLGTRGVMNAPFTATALYNKVFNDTEIDNEMNISRYQHYNK
ncbi:FAD-binding oxidoreductase [Capnocytophaga sp.]|uniref:NAD(P)/FAD-dependent oxidoreductase n=1 Tax=Capnocytophaga sp. TaxID=44737 RepID=UPI0026DB6AC6|nr:FAD-dependent oxidoreductase [Capnocytophaga sp.]MDO5105050.1 FAD-dependent oxidoreductase [Capnocytophaga sp.]